MSIFKILIGKNKVVPIRQSEENECGLACIAMIFGYFNHYISLNSLRTLTGQYSQGMSIIDIVRMLSKFKMDAKVIRYDTNNFRKLNLPCIIHWENNHYVVLEEIRKNHVYIVDPNIGRRKVDIDIFFEKNSCIAILISNFFGVKIKQDDLVEDVKKLSIFDVSKKLILVVVSIFFILEMMASILPIAFSKILLDINSVQQKGDYFISLPFLSVIFLFFLHVLVSYYSRLRLLQYEKNLQVNWTENFVYKLFSRKVSFFETRGTGDIITRVQSIEVMKNFVKSSFLLVLMKGVTSLFIVLFLAYIDIYIAVLVFVFIAIMVLIRFFYSNKIISLENDFVIHQAKHMGSLIESIRSISAIFVNNRSFDRVLNWGVHFSNHMNISIKLDKEIYNEYFVFSLLNFLNRLAVIGYALFLLKKQDLNIDGFIFVIIYREAIFYRILDTISESLVFLRIKGHKNRVEEVLNYPESISTNETNNSYLGSVGFSVSDLSFKYPGSRDFVFKNLSFHVELGQSIAITGRSGVGKTTIFKTILGFYDDYKGLFEIIDSHGKRNKVNSHYLRNISGVVLQDDHLFTGDIYQNVSLFSENVNIKKVERCLEIACIKDEIESMKLGYSTIISEGANNISIGQKQRILLARALYKDPLILFLDESTSNLDVALERKIASNLRDLEITKIFIAHRPETIDSADVVYFLKDGSLEKI